MAYGEPITYSWNSESYTGPARYRSTVYSSTWRDVARFRLARSNSGYNVSIDHPRFFDGTFRTGGAWDFGEYFWTLSPAVMNETIYIGPALTYDDKMYQEVGNASNNFAASRSDDVLRGQGTTAIARSLPTNPSSGLATFLGELREGAPRAVGSSLFKDRVAAHRALGDEYLNVEFGWKPLVRDLRSFSHSVKNANKIIASYRKGSDKKIKRRYDYPNEYSYVNFVGGAYTHSDAGMYWNGAHSVEEIRSTWFEGAFRYHVPVPDSTMGKLLEYEALANHVLGTRLTPEVVWNLTPWTWAADWFSNTGDVIHNISSLGLDGLAMEYGYIMHKMDQTMHCWTEQTQRVTGSGYKFPGRSSVTRKYRTRRRIPASPYGFAIGWDGMTPRQIAIAAALGITKS